GDYSGIGVDPADDCTFWYTTEYMSGGSSATRVVSFRLDPDFVVAPSPTVVDMCGAAGDAVYSVSLAKTCALAGSVAMSTSGVPIGATISWSANTVTPPGNTTLTLGNLGSVASGTYNIDIIGTAAGPIVRQETVVLNLQTAAPAAATLSLPEDGTSGVAADTALSWAAAARASTYDVQVATDPGFVNVVRSATGLTGTSYTPNPTLDLDTVYYWRVRGSNACGSSDYSATWAFRTVASSCLTYTSTNIPKAISNGQWAESTLTVGDSFTATDVDLTIGHIDHGRTGQLSIYIRHPDSSEIELSTGNGGTGDDYVDTTFDDEAVLSIAGQSAPFTGRFRPEGSLSVLDGEDVNGTWLLRIFDSSAPTTGALNSWNLTLCHASVLAADYSDLAGSYGVAWHTGDGALRLGNNWTADTTFAEGDDNERGDDGVTVPSLVAGQSNSVVVNVQGTPSSGRYLRIWFDWDSDGVFDDDGGELVWNGTVSAGNNSIPVPVPAGLSQPVSYRARLYDSASAPTGILSLDPRSYGGAEGGEVEDGTVPAPTAVTLARFEAVAAGGSIRLEWETATELNHLGFNLYRSDTLRGAYARLNEVLIASQAPGSPTGAVYTWTDAGVEPGTTYYYELEDVDLHGVATRHGPVEVTAAYGVYLPVMLR
ncbi:MAG: proprotein convertase P-domain-containing protein, partial [Anaerolineae bacterium]|nr:proprotein convertase P-domain-containing protein [Anaerolineae bacterium]